MTIKYLGSKRRLVPVLTELFERSGATTALDLFTGTTRVAQAYKRAGGRVTAVDTARYSEVFARTWIETDAATVDRRVIADEVARLDALPGRPGYVTETFCQRSRFFQPHNGERIDAIRQAIADDHAGTWLEPILLTSLLLAADRVDSTTGLQMAYVKQWAPRSVKPLRLEVPDLLPGGGAAVRGDATVDEAEINGKFDGTLVVRKCLTINATGRITGTVRYGELRVEQGGQVSGEIQAEDAKQAARPALKPADNGENKSDGKIESSSPRSSSMA